MKKILPFVLISLFLLSESACKRLRQPEAVAQRQEFIESLNDSISAYRAAADSAEASLTAIQNSISGMVGDFDHVSNPREVEGYYIYKGWKNRYPLKQTGIVARITEDEGFELIAVLSGAWFSRVEASAASRSASTAAVPHDQALNYRAGNLNTVCFSDSAAFPVAELIAEAKDGNVAISFFNEGSRTGSISSLPADQKDMIAATWRLFASQRKAHELEKKISLYSRRIDLCRRMLQANDSVKN